MPAVRIRSRRTSLISALPKCALALLIQATAANAIQIEHIESRRLSNFVKTESDKSEGLVASQQENAHEMAELRDELQDLRKRFSNIENQIGTARVLWSRQEQTSGQ